MRFVLLVASAAMLFPPTVPEDGLREETDEDEPLHEPMAKPHAVSLAETKGVPIMMSVAGLVDPFPVPFSEGVGLFKEQVEIALKSKELGYDIAVSGNSWAELAVGVTFPRGLILEELITVVSKRIPLNIFINKAWGEGSERKFVQRWDIGMPHAQLLAPWIPAAEIARPDGSKTSYKQADEQDWGYEFLLYSQMAVYLLLATQQGNQWKVRLRWFTGNPSLFPTSAGSDPFGRSTSALYNAIWTSLSNAEHIVTWQADVDRHVFSNEEGYLVEPKEPGAGHTWDGAAPTKVRDDFARYVYDVNKIGGSRLLLCTTDRRERRTNAQLPALPLPLLDVDEMMVDAMMVDA